MELAGLEPATSWCDAATLRDSGVQKPAGVQGLRGAGQDRLPRRVEWALDSLGSETAGA